MKLRIHRFISKTKAEGPGVRACIWVQGCPIQCQGCLVPQTWSTEDGEVITVKAMAKKILAIQGIEGVTFLGGEPFQQAGALAELASILRLEGLSILTFTGYVLEKIEQANNSAWNALLQVTDLLIDGPFKQELLDTTRPWVGSSNQRYHFLTERYLSIKGDLLNIPNRLELRISPDGQIKINGLATEKEIEELLKFL